ncbi:MAG: hypothetical protein ACOX69_09345 [Coriobacteriales bacterium]|jgi:DNA-binding MarR family transcriptional regulator
MTESRNAPICPGCHFACKVDRYQCGRGHRFYQTWLEGGEVPARRPPQSKSPADELPLEKRIEHMLAVVPRVLRIQAHESFDDQVLLGIERHEGLAAVAIVSGELSANSAAVASAAANLQEKGLVATAAPREGAEMLQVTEKGRDYLEELNRRHAQTSERFFGVLSKDEREKLLELLEKTLRSQPRPQHRN